MLSPFPLIGALWESPLSKGLREISVGNFDKAYELFQTEGGSDLNRCEAIYGRALCYWYGIGVEMQRCKARELLEGDNNQVSPLKLKEGDVKIAAQYMLGMYYLHYYEEEEEIEENEIEGEKSGNEEDNIQKGIRYLESAAIEGHALSQYELGLYYYQCVILGERNTLREEEVAVHYLNMAIDNPTLSSTLKLKAEEILKELSSSIMTYE